MNSDDKPKIRVLMMLEVIGKPAEHLVAALEDLIKKLDEEQGVTVQKKDIKEPKLIESKEGAQPSGFYTTFAEVEIDIEEISSLAYLIFRYMPAHIEVISPEVIALTNNGWNELFNELSRKLHGYDEVVRIVQVEKNILEKKLKELMGKSEGEEK